MKKTLGVLLFLLSFIFLLTPVYAKTQNYEGVVGDKLKFILGGSAQKYKIEKGSKLIKVKHKDGSLYITLKKKGKATVVMYNKRDNSIKFNITIKDTKTTKKQPKNNTYTSLIEQLKTTTEYDSFGNLVVITENPTDTDIPSLTINYTETDKISVYLPKGLKHAHLFYKSAGIPDNIKDTIKYTYEPDGYSLMYNGDVRVEIGGGSEARGGVVLDENRNKIRGVAKYTKPDSLAEEKVYVDGVILLRDMNRNLIKAHPISEIIDSKSEYTSLNSAISDTTLLDIEEMELIFTSKYNK